MVSYLEHDPPPARPRPTAGDEQLREIIERSSALRLSKRAINGGLSPLGIGDTLKGHLRLSVPPESAHQGEAAAA